MSLTQRDHSLITQYLTPLSNQELINVGLRLGLRYPTLKKMNQESLLNDMVHAWLRRDDDVAEVAGEPTWESLSTALEESGHKGIASDIKTLNNKDHSNVNTPIVSGPNGIAGNKDLKMLSLSNISPMAAVVTQKDTMAEHVSYHEAITGSEAEERLKRCTSHGYLTRYSENHKCYSLTVYQKEPNNVIKHFKISFRTKDEKVYREG